MLLWITHLELSGTVCADEPVAQGDDFQIPSWQGADGKAPILAHRRPTMPLRRQLLRIAPPGPDVRDDASVLHRPWHRVVELTAHGQSAFQVHEQFIRLPGRSGNRDDIAKPGGTF